MTQDPRDVRLTRNNAEVDDDNPLPVEIVEGGNAPDAEPLSSASLAAAASETLAPTAPPADGVTHRLQQVIISGEVPWTAVIQSNDGSTVTEIATLHGEAGSSFDFQPRNARAALYEVTGNVGGTAQFEVVVTHNGITGALPGNIRAHVAWDVLP